MKKIIYLFAIVFSFAAVSCSDENLEKVSNPVTVTKADTEFDATGGTASIQVAGTGVKAKADDTWLTVTVENTEVKLTAEPNKDLLSRHTVVTIFADQADSVCVNVSQNGAFFRTDAPSNIKVATDAAMTFTYTVESSFPTTVKSLNEDWLDVTLENGNLLVKLGENKTGAPRTGKYVLTNMESNDTLSVTQYDVSTDIFGEYEMLFKAADKNYYKIPVTITETSIKMTVDSTDFTIPASLVEGDEIKLAVKAGQYMGKYTDKTAQKDYFCYFIYMNSTGDRWTGYSTTYTGNLVLNVTEDGVKGSFVGTYDSFCMEGFNAQSLAAANDETTLLEVYSPVFTKP